VKALTLEFVSRSSGGHLNARAEQIDPNRSVTGLATDSREITVGDVFVAIPGERVDGHDFAQQAVESGASAVLAQRDLPDLPCIVVEDVVMALGSIAAAYRREMLSARVIAITGSSGKTTTKDLVAQVLPGNVVAAQGSFNTEVGVPLTILDADEGTEFLVLEMGMRGLGHIRYLCTIAQPDISLVLNVGSAHVGMLGGPEDVARAKGEIVERLPAAAVAVLNADDPQVAAMVDRTAARVLTFGESPTSDVRARAVRLDSLGRATFDLIIADQPAETVSLQLHGEHFVSAALAAAAIGHVVGMSCGAIAERLCQAQPRSRWRMEVRTTARGVTVVNDAYNANPESVRAALKTLRSMQGGGRTWAVLGEMRELGAASLDEHDAIGRLAVRLDISRLVCVGDATKVMHLAASNEGSWGDESMWVPDIESAIAILDQQLEPGDVVLLKASRAVGLEVIATHLLGDEEVSA